MATVSITYPAPSSTEDWTFPAGGGFTSAPTQVEEEAANQIVCTLSSSTGQTIQVQTYALASHVPPSGTWEVEFSVDQNYTGCTITAVLELNGALPPYPTASVNPINISDS